MKSLKHKLSTDILVSTFLELSSRIRGIVNLTLLTSALGVASYGAFMQLLAITSILGLIASFSLREGFENFSQDRDIDTSQLYYSILLVTLSVSVLIAVSVAFYATALAKITLGDTQYATVFLAGSALIPIKILAKMGTGYYRAEMRVKTGAIILAIVDYLEVFTVIVTAHVLSYSLTKVVLSIVAVKFIYVSAIQISVVRSLGFGSPSFENLLEVLRYSGWLTVSSIGGQISSRADRLLLGYFIGAPAVGIYSIAYGLASLLLGLVAPIRSTFFPEFSRLLEQNRIDEISRYTTGGLRYFLLLSIPGLVGYCFVAEPLLQLFVSTEEAAEASVFVPVIAIGIIFFGLDQVQGTGLLAAGKTKPISLIRSSASMGNVLLNVFLIPLIGVMGAAIATTLTYILSSGAVHLLFQRNFPFPFDIISIVKIGVATAMMATILSILPKLNVFFTIAVGFITYSCAITAVGGVDIDSIWNLVSGDKK